MLWQPNEYPNTELSIIDRAGTAVNNCNCIRIPELFTMIDWVSVEIGLPEHYFSGITLLPFKTKNVPILVLTGVKFGVKFNALKI